MHLGLQKQKTWKERVSTKLSKGVLSKKFHHSGGGVSNKLDSWSTKVSKATKGARELWERRGMMGLKYYVSLLYIKTLYLLGVDKSITSSLADHDGCPNPSTNSTDAGGTYVPNVVAGRSDTSGQYEKGLVETLVAPGGLSKEPPVAALSRFVELATTLNVEVISTCLLSELESSSWQVRFKGLCVVEALVTSYRGGDYVQWMTDHAVPVLQKGTCDGKASIRKKSSSLLHLLGIQDNDHVQRPTTTPDLLGFDGLATENLTLEIKTPLVVSIPNEDTSDLIGFLSLEEQECKSRDRVLSDFGKDLFAAAHSPSAYSPQPMKRELEEDRTSSNDGASPAHASGFSFLQ